MSYHKENLKEQIVEIAWDICKTESWQKVNMRKVAKEAKVSTTAFYRHFRKKDDLKAELMRRGYEIIDEGRKDADAFASWGAHYIRFGLDYPHIYDLMFGNIDLDMSLYPDLEALHDAAFDEVYLALKPFMPDASKRDIKIKAVNIWTSIHGLVGLLRREVSQGGESKELKWIENNLEDYLKMTTFR
ncbi:TetR/AcrR family transcriptional regulator [Gammaproteobacteria bacterium]|nr:TetR/AcrR family transcriptional regulator [Gammaproteobacteria bacterium]